MSDWNTLHLFDSKRFYSSIAPELKNKGQFINKYINSKLYWYITRIDKIEEISINKLQEFIKNLDTSFKFHTKYREMINPSRRIDETYQQSLVRIKNNYNQFQEKYQEEIYYYTTIMPLIMFSECAQFNPHLIMGRRIFKGNVKAKTGSVAKECIDKIIEQEIGGFANDIGHIINWLTYEEVKLLWYDRENLQINNEGSELYLSDFIRLLNIAFDNKLGLMTINNVNEDVINLIESPRLKININLDEMKSKSVIEFNRE